MKNIISSLIVLIGLLGGYYSYSEFQSIEELEQTLEYKTNQTIDNLALNYLGVERENIFAKELKRRKKQTTILSIGSILLIIAGIVLLFISNSKSGVSQKSNKE